MAAHFLGVIEPMLRDGERYADLSVEQLVRLGGIARSTFYEYFDDKWALLAAMADDVLKQLLFVAENVWAKIGADSTKRDLRDALRPAFREYQKHQPILSAVSEASAHDKTIGAYQEMLLDGSARGLGQHVREAQKQGSAAPDLDPERTARWLLAMLDRGLSTLISNSDERENERQLDVAVDIYWRTLYAGFRPEA